MSFAGGSGAVQRLPPETRVRCSGCGRMVVFRLVATRAMSRDASRLYAYLVCPECGHRATQTRFRRRAAKS